MSQCCDPKNPVYMLTAGGIQVGLTRVDEAFQAVKGLGLGDEKAAEKLLEIVKQKNFIPPGAELEYKLALLAAYKNFIAKS